MWRAVAHLEMGEETEAALALWEGAKKGLWWNPEDLARIKGRMSDGKLRALMERLESTSRNFLLKRVPPVAVLRRAGSSVWLMVLHGRDGGIDEEYPRWEAAPANLAFVQSSQPFSYGSYCWDVLQEATAEVLWWWRALKGLGQVVVAGFSQGARLGLSLALKGEMDTEAFIAVSPADNDPIAPKRRMRVIIMVGRNDKRRPRAEEQCSIINEQRGTCWLVLFEGGHHYPSDFEELLRIALDRVLE
ncbi:hypothetical protein HS1genome_2237 [Sulfodiicoccus acidiphilus]|uniref:Phospholipase/carboxylesterase/thioesterase domain-containing protein n=2 Tax=Sulfodiicoccus acidiphilus TaxID=1670455 RepID=A0A348B6P6_9CREN|nr:hypothetical protein HS1genome_2237 [Sulfodiicoccus acidiphilus]GGT96341.1 hypothetical protein GCM10007116_12390 [Sulfodiicoccus acidiphilus]